MVLVLPILMLALRIFGTPQHVTRRPSSVSFWAADLSCGAGAISSPVLLEHPKNVSECAMLWERTISEVSKGAPNWLLLSAVGIATRELASRQVQEGLVPALVTSGEARPKAKALSQRLRRNHLCVRRLPESVDSVLVSRRPVRLMQPGISRQEQHIALVHGRQVHHLVALLVLDQVIR